VSPDGERRFSQRAERVLVRVLLALRREARPHSADSRRAEELADAILSDFPRRILPFGMAALAVIAVVCAAPLLRDLAVEHGVSSGGVCAVAVVESGLRGRSAEVSDGVDALRAVVAPFSPGLVGGASEALPEDARDESNALPKEASAPFSRS